MKKLLIGLLMSLLVMGGGCSKFISEFTSTPEIRTVVEIDRSVYRATVQGHKATIQMWALNSIEWQELLIALEPYNINHIHMIWRNPGGGVIDMMHMIDTFDQLKMKGVKMTAHATGWVASAAVPLFLMADYRTADNNAVFMMHPHSGWNRFGKDYRYDTLGDGPSKAHLIRMYNMWNDIYCRIVTQNSDMCLGFCMDIMAPEEWNSDTGMVFFMADEAEGFGFVDEVI